MSKLLIAENFQHDNVNYKKGKVVSGEELEQVMTEKQAKALFEAGCLKHIESDEPSEPLHVEEAAVSDEAEPSESTSEGKKKKGKK